MHFDEGSKILENLKSDVMALLNLNREEIKIHETKTPQIKTHLNNIFSRECSARARIFSDIVQKQELKNQNELHTLYFQLCYVFMEIDDWSINK